MDINEASLTIEQVETIVLLIRDPFWQISDLEADERTALSMLAKGRSVQDVAYRLNVTRRTAYRVVERGLRQLNRMMDRQPGNEIHMEQLTALAFQMLEKEARLPIFNPKEKSHE